MKGLTTLLDSCWIAESFGKFQSTRNKTVTPTNRLIAARPATDD
jgi:hypothetical protein